MTERIRRAMAHNVALTLLLTMLVILLLLYQGAKENQFAHQHDNLQMLAEGVSQGGLHYLEALHVDSYRITWIDHAGTVLFDSEVEASTMENHSGRIEFQEAQKGGMGESQRVSHTLSEETLYSAKRLSDGSVIRISSTQASIWALMFSLCRPLLLLGLVIVLTSRFVSGKVAKKLVDPINHLDLEQPLSNTIYGELSPLLSRIHSQNQKIREQMQDILRKKHEIAYITENVADGIVLLNAKGYVVSANKVAVQILGCAEGQHFLECLRDLSFQESLQDALGGKESGCKLCLNERQYALSASPTKVSDADFAVFLYMQDVSEEEKALQQRREFSANVSHELKTPLTTIMGTAEIMASGLVAPSDTQDFAQRIYEEAQRLLRLIQDIIRISRLDEKQHTYSLAPVDLQNVAQTVLGQLQDKARHLGLHLEGKTMPATIQGVEHILHEMVYNLCDNALQYNRPNGMVILRLENSIDGILLSVSDTGKGISQEHLPHIFERFYRVDKSHSSTTGGTGLGLSIVKNGAELHSATVDIQSVPDEGTRITLRFPA